MAETPRMWVFAGSNGSGKSTFASRFLGRFRIGIEFVNPDIIAAELASDRDQDTNLAAGRRAIEQTNELLAARRNFAIETTLSGQRVNRLVRGAVAEGWVVTLIYMWIGNTDLANSRIEYGFGQAVTTYRLTTSKGVSDPV